ncbi:hypothetical protein CSA37_01595 [Candidatus Fermentibacteria bacterium]|nr:MAG: hypothetical protein CSA37_13535 [Candidatus Fermentibacteria bacterium]PIE53377.1 MAG: hypothetical protein CSA37_01595 [Candidatus Fermentibacteria bacterium]
MRNPEGLPEIQGYSGLIVQGWNLMLERDFTGALEWFINAMEVDVNRPEAYLGAGVASIFLNEYHSAAEGYLQTAIQLDQGHSAIINRVHQSLVQDTLWTVIECVDRDLPEDSLQSWLSATKDSGLVWVGSSIMDYLTSNTLDTDLSFRLKLNTDSLGACVELYNT